MINLCRLFIKSSCYRRSFPSYFQPCGVAYSTEGKKPMPGQPPVLPVVSKSDIPRLFNLTKLNDLLFRAEFHGNPSPKGDNIYGGLLVAQGLQAAQAQVGSQFVPTALHTLFVSFPYSQKPVDYSIEKLRDGKSFCARYVKGVQGDNVVFAGIANFSKPEEPTFYHSHQMPEISKPMETTEFFGFCEECLNEIEEGKLKVSERQEAVFRDRVFDKPNSVLDIRLAQPREHFGLKKTTNNPLQFWLKSSIPLDDDMATHRAMLCYLSDMYLVGASIHPHISHGNVPAFVSSLDCTIWFHNYKFRADEWLLYEVHSTAADSGRALSHGKIWTEDGCLVASTSQEVLARFKNVSKL